MGFNWFEKEKVDRGYTMKVSIKEKERVFARDSDAQTMHEEDVKEIKINGGKWFYGYMMM